MALGRIRSHHLCPLNVRNSVCGLRACGGGRGRGGEVAAAHGRGDLLRALGPVRKGVHQDTFFFFALFLELPREVSFFKFASSFAERKRGMSVLVGGSVINHRLSRTGLTNVRPDSGIAERKRGAPACPSKPPWNFHPPTSVISYSPQSHSACPASSSGKGKLKPRFRCV